MNDIRTVTPDPNVIRDSALRAGAIDPITLRFQVVEVDKFDGTMLGVAAKDIGFSEALEFTHNLTKTHAGSHFYLQPVGFIQ